MRKTSTEINLELASAIKKWRGARTDQEQDRAYEAAERAAKPLLVGRARHFASDTRNDKDDLLQAGRLAIWKALRTFDESRSQPILYFSFAIKRAMISHVTTKKNVRATSSLYILDESGEEVENLVGSHDNVQEWLDDFISHGNIETIIETLSTPAQRDLLKVQYIEDIERYQEIADRLGINEKRVDNVHCAAIRNLKKMADRGEITRELSGCQHVYNLTI